MRIKNWNDAPAVGAPGAIAGPDESLASVMSATPVDAVLLTGEAARRRAVYLGDWYARLAAAERLAREAF